MREGLSPLFGSLIAFLVSLSSETCIHGLASLMLLCANLSTISFCQSYFLTSRRNRNRKKGILKCEKGSELVFLKILNNTFFRLGGTIHSLMVLKCGYCFNSQALIFHSDFYFHDRKDERK